MSLIKCPECGKVFSDRADHCPHCGLPIADALKDIAAPQRGEALCQVRQAGSESTPKIGDFSGPPHANMPSPAEPEYTRQDYDNIPLSMPTPPEKPGRQGNLMMYVLIVAVVVLAIVCIAMIANSGSGGSGDFGGDDDSIGTISTLPPDTLPQTQAAPGGIMPSPAVGTGFDARPAEEPEPEFTQEAEGTTETESATPADSTKTPSL